MTATFDEQDLHRLVKHALDSGAAKTVAEAEAMFRGYRLAVALNEHALQRAEHQIAALTTIALARRVFHGGVRVTGALDVPLALPLPLGRTIGHAAAALGADLVSRDGEPCPTISVSEDSLPRSGDFHIRTVSAGWAGGIVPADAERVQTTAYIMPLAPMLAAALAVNEAFTHVAEPNSAAGRQRIGLSLWDPTVTSDWLAPPAVNGPCLELLPSRLWLLGLGHLGQAFLWALGLLPYPSAASLELVLQDTDMITRSTESTSILTDATMVGQKKTRAMAAWAERRGFRTALHERTFDALFRRQETEPSVALCGIDNALGRRALDQAGFPLVIEAGLGRGHRDFRTMRLHTLPGSRTAAALWNSSASGEDMVTRPAYQHLLSEGSIDRCGAALLAGKAVGAPFVGAVAATLAVSEVLRFLHGGVLSEVIDVDLRCLEHRSIVPTSRTFNSFNPGYLRVPGHT